MRKYFGAVVDSCSGTEANSRGYSFWKVSNKLEESIGDTAVLVIPSVGFSSAVIQKRTAE